ncbi:MAG: efflux RND transporter permease subunit, partial [Bacteroidales bacterium]
AVKNSNLDIGARTIEFNRVEYLVRALGYIESLEDLEKSVVKVKDNVPIRLGDVAKIQYGPATRRGGLDKDGAEAVGGAVVARYGANPMETIENLKAKIEEISPGLPSKTLDDGSRSKIEIVPFYDRTGLIKETLGTLEEAISLQLLISILVIIVLMLNLNASFLISGLLPLGVLMTFILMRQFGVDANIVALSGIAISIGVMIDVGVIFTENIIRHIKMKKNSGAKGIKLLNIIFNGTKEVSGAVLTAITTTIVSFLPVFAMEAAEGKLFKPLAYTKTFTMIAALIIGLIIIPALAHLLFSVKTNKTKYKQGLNLMATVAGIVLTILSGYYIALAISAFGINNFLAARGSEKQKSRANSINIGIMVAIVVYYLSKIWMPMGAQNSLLTNYIFVLSIVAVILILLSSIVWLYPRLLKWLLLHKRIFIVAAVIILLFGTTTWQGFSSIFGFMPGFIKDTRVYESLERSIPGLGREFMPTLDEGSFLLMPTTMPHSGIEENLEVIRLLDRRVHAIPEVETVVGKWGRVNSALDPAPTSMYENVINYKPEYILDEEGHRKRFKTNDKGAFMLENGDLYTPGKDQFRLIPEEQLIRDDNGEYFRQWREKIQSEDDIWNEIVSRANIPGLTSAPKLQPIATRLVMLQTGMRAPMGIKIFGPDLETIEETGLTLESHLKEVEGVSQNSVFADRVVGKPYLEINIDRNAAARYGLSVKELQNILSGAVGGITLTNTVEGRERFPVRIRYAREFREHPGELENILIPTQTGAQIPLSQVANITYRQGPQMIKSENTFPVSYVIFDKTEGYAEVDVVENAQDYLNGLMDSGDFELPAGVSYVFTGNYENQIRATKRLTLVIPISLIVIFLILFFQFRSVTSTSLIFSGILLAFSGGFIMLWLYSQPWFLDITIAGTNMRELFQLRTVNLSVAVWVGFIALFGIATDDGVLISTYIKQSMNKHKPATIDQLRAVIVEAGSKRIRPAMMTTATTLIALLPVLSSTGKGSNIMGPMAIPLFGGMLIAVITVFMVPVLYSAWQERILIKNHKKMPDNK